MRHVDEGDVVLDAEVDEVVVVPVPPDHDVQEVAEAQRGGREHEEVLRHRDELVAEARVLLDERVERVVALSQIGVQVHVVIVSPPHQHQRRAGVLADHGAVHEVDGVEEGGVEEEVAVHVADEGAVEFQLERLNDRGKERGGVAVGSSG